MTVARSKTAVSAPSKSLRGDSTGTIMVSVAVARASSQCGGPSTTPSAIAMFGQVNGTAIGAAAGALLATARPVSSDSVSSRIESSLPCTERR